MSTVQPVSGCNLARQMRQSRQRNRQRIFKEWMWTILTRKTKQIGVVKHGENKHRKYDERDEANGMKQTERDEANRKHCTAICLSLLVLKVVVVEFLSIYLSCLWVTFSCLF